MLCGLILESLLTLRVQEPRSTLIAARSQAMPAATEAHTRDGRPVKPPERKEAIAPKWPPNAFRAGLHGQVTLKCAIGANGHVEDVIVVDGYRSLAEEASRTVRQWRYAPTRLDGKAVPVILTVKVDFDLPSPPKREDTLEALHDPDPEIREAALVWLSSYRPVTEQQRAAVESAVVDSSPIVQRVAQQALEKLNSLPADDLAASETDARADVPPTGRAGAGWRPDQEAKETQVRGPDLSRDCEAGHGPGDGCSRLRDQPPGHRDRREGPARHTASGSSGDRYREEVGLCADSSERRPGAGHHDDRRRLPPHQLRTGTGQHLAG